MSTAYVTLNLKITRAIRDHLMEVDALPPTIAMAELASELADLVFVELNGAGITLEAIENVVSLNTSNKKALAQGAAVKF